LYNTVVAGQTVDDPDQLYAQRTNLASAERAATIWEERLSAQANDFEAAWKLARAAYWLGGHAATGERRKSRSTRNVRKAISGRQPTWEPWLNRPACGA
jgi:hypothetical protein